MIEIRRATINDIKTLTTLFDNYRIFYKKVSDIENAEKFVSERLIQEDSVFYVGVNESSSIVGFVQLYPIFSSTKMQRLWLLNDLYVDENHRGKGISKELIQASKKLCDETNACGLLLETAKSNDIGNELYPNTEFSLDIAHNHYYWDRQ